MLRSCARCGRIHKPGQCSVPVIHPTKITPARQFRGLAAWRHLADWVRDRDNNLCVACIHEDPMILTSSTLEVHHIIPIAEDWDKRLEETNCITLCRVHHEMAESGQIDRQTLINWIE